MIIAAELEGCEVLCIGGGDIITFFSFGWWVPFEVCGPGERDTKWLVAVLGGNLTIKNEDNLDLFYLQLSSKG
jgi:hypothetical protein